MHSQHLITIVYYFFICFMNVICEQGDPMFRMDLTSSGVLPTSAKNIRNFTIMGDRSPTPLLVSNLRKYIVLTLYVLDYFYRTIQLYIYDRFRDIFYNSYE